MNAHVNHLSSTAQLDALKRLAKRNARTSGLNHSQCLDAIAQQMSYGKWSQLAKAFRIKDAAQASADKVAELLSAQTPAQEIVAAEAPVDAPISQDMADAAQTQPLTASEQLDEERSNPRSKNPPSGKSKASKKIRWLSATTLGRELGLSAAKVKAILISKKVIRADGTPTQDSLDRELVLRRVCHDKFGGSGADVEYNVYNVEALGRHLPKPNPATVLGRPKSHFHADRQFNGILAHALNHLMSEQQKEQARGLLGSAGELIGLAPVFVEQLRSFDSIHLYGGLNMGPYGFYYIDNPERLHEVMDELMPLFSELREHLLSGSDLSRKRGAKVYADIVVAAAEFTLWMEKWINRNC